MKIMDRTHQGDMRVVKSQMTEVNQLVEGLTWRIVRCVETRLPLRINSMVCEFIMDDNHQAWFTHASDLFTSAKEKKWHPPSGNESKLEPDIQVRPQLVRRKPLRDGTPVCSGDFCHANVAQLLGQQNADSAENDLSVFMDDPNLNKVEQSKTKSDRSLPLHGSKSILYKSIFLARMDASGGNAGGEDPIAKEHLNRRVLPQLQPTIQARHSLHDYYEMVPVCDSCYKVYCHYDRERSRCMSCMTQKVPETPDFQSVSMFSSSQGTRTKPDDGGYDMSAKGIRQRLTDLFTTQAKPLANNLAFLAGKQETSGISGMIGALKRAPGPKAPLGKRSASVMQESYADRRLPNLAAQQGKAFPRSKTSMLGGNKVRSDKRGVNTLPSLV